MPAEENIKQDLVSRFTFLEGKITLPRPRRLFCEVDYGNFPAVFDYAVKQLQFCHLCTITGLDEPDKLSFIYHLGQDSGVVLSIKTSVAKDEPVLKSVTDYFLSADIYERELRDLFGAKVEGLPAGNRYPLTDDWPVDQFPLRKDWKPDSAK